MIKKLIYISICILICANFVFAQTQDAYIKYNGYEYEFKPGDELKFLKNADRNTLLAEKSQTIIEKVFYLQEAMRYYFLLSQIRPSLVDAQIGLGRVYDELKLDKYAKEHFYIALNFDNKNPATNMYFANFYYKRNDLISAHYYYDRAYKYGYSTNYYLNCRLGTIHEKLADIGSAKKFYSIALRLNPKNNNELINKIRLLDELNYSQSQYRLFHKR